MFGMDWRGRRLFLLELEVEQRLKLIFAKGIFLGTVEFSQGQNLVFNLPGEKQKSIQN